MNGASGRPENASAVSGRLRRFSPGRLPFALARLNFRRMEECATIIRWLDARAGEHILDIGCGDGAYDCRIARTGARVTGIDIHERRLAAARLYCQSHRTTFLFMDASSLDFDDATFDKAVSFCVVEHLANDDRVLRNVARVLRPGGLFVFSADSLSNPGITEAERRRHRARYAVNTFYTAENVRAKLDRAGFDLLGWRYILSSRMELAVVRASWKLDDLPGVFGPLRPAGYLALGAFRWLAGRSPARRAASADAGLTLLVKAVRRPAPLAARSVSA